MIKDAKCQACDYSASSAGDVYKHTKKVHLELKTHACDQCPYTAKCKSALDKHKTGHNLPEEDRLRCMECDKSFRHKEYLFAHVKSAHSKAFQCNVCDGKTFSSGNSLKRHIEIVHNGVKKHQCSHCNKKFALGQHLSLHEKVVHLKLRPYKCDVCEATFPYALSLRQHVSSLHATESGAEVFPCDRCEDKTFSSASSLKKHKEVLHSEAKKYKCNDCRAAFTKKFRLNRHKMKFHNLGNVTMCEELTRSYHKSL